MSALHDENPEPISKVMQVRQAANTLGISERTVYRRLRSGKLEQLPSESPGTDNVMSNVSEERLTQCIQEQIAPAVAVMRCQNDMTNDNMSVLRQDLARRDAQIDRLLETQQELTHTIQKLQSQIFELARLALTQPAKADEMPETLAETPLVGAPAPTKRSKGLRGWLRTVWGSDRDR